MDKTQNNLDIQNTEFKAGGFEDPLTPSLSPLGRGRG
jgi:hypothetical protein